IFRAEQMAYSGTQLTGYADRTAGTTYSYSYDHEGRLIAAAASHDGATADVAQSFNETYCYSIDKCAQSAAGGPSFWNLEKVTTASDAQVYNYSTASPD